MQLVRQAFLRPIGRQLRKAGPMFLAPLAEAPPIGRKPVYLVTLFIFVVLKFPVIYAPNIATLLVFRFLTVCVHPKSATHH